jgi:hypothetical protein
VWDAKPKRSVRPNPPRPRAVDCRRHPLTVYDGASMIGSLVERAGKFEAFDLAGQHLGTYPDMRAAVRAIPAVRARKENGRG